MIRITDRARRAVLRMMATDRMPENSCLRIKVIRGGCSGLSYELSFDHKMKADDHAVEDRGLRILADKESMGYLNGLTLDYSGGLNGKGFEFNNPNATRTCHCGESFSV